MAFKDEINYERISQINKKERKSSKIISLDPDFYQALISHLNELQGEYNKKHSESPTSTEALLLNNEICKLDVIIKEIYNRRERKVLLSTLDQGLKNEIKNMLEHEQRLYKKIIEILNQFREEVLYLKPKPVCDTLEPEKPVELEIQEQEQEIKEEMQLEGENAEAVGSGPSDTTLDNTPGKSQTEIELNIEEKDEVEIVKKDDDKEIEDKKKAAEDDIEHVLVHVLEDLEQFVGTDMIVYNLHKEDLATIPKDIAEILKKNNKKLILLRQISRTKARLIFIFFQILKY
jgi:DNA replication initiation complex subunit (GINS family)